MNILKTLALVVSLSVPGLLHAAAAHVQSTGISSAGGLPVASLGKTFNSSVTAGSAILIGAICDTNLCTGASIFSDDQGGAYTRIVQTGDTALGRALNVAGGSTTVTLTPDSPDFIGFGISEFSGVATSSADDGSNSGTGTSTSAASGSITTTAAGVRYAVMNINAAQSITESGWSVAYEDESWSAIVAQPARWPRLQSSRSPHPLRSRSACKR
jgi:hypothetical protein